MVAGCGLLLHILKHLVSWLFELCKLQKLAKRRPRGIVNMYGVFQTFYSHSIAETSTTSAISWIGSIQVFLLCFIGTLVGPIYDSGYCRSLVVTGTFLTVFGIFMTSICKNYWQLFLAQGVVTGAGFGCLFLPGVAIVSQYFSTKKAFATGIASLGSSIG